MNILIISPWYPNPIHLQDGNFVRAQAELLSRRHRVEVLTVFEGARSQVQREVEESGVRVIRCEYNGDGIRIQRLLRRRNAWKTVLAQRQLQPDLIHAHVLIDGGIIANKLARRLGVPFVITAHSHRWLERWPLGRLPELLLARRAARRASFLLPVSPSLLQGLKQHAVSADYRVVPNVIKTELFYPGAPIAGRPFTFLHVSDFSANKNLPDIVVAFAQVHRLYPKTKLHLAGNGDHEQVAAMVAQIAGQQHPSVALPVTISGPHNQAEIAELMRASDFFVLASTLETQSLVVIEALMSGLPVISTRSGGPEDILRSLRHGELVRIHDVEAITKAMKRFAEKGPVPYQERRLYATAARKIFGNVEEQLSDIYTRITS